MPAPTNAGYQLGDFGFEQQPKESRAELPVAPPPARGDDVSLDLELAAELPVPPTRTRGDDVSKEPRAELPVAPARARGDDVSLDLELAGGLPLELEQTAARPMRAGAAAARENSGLHALGERFNELAPAHVPQIEERAFRAIQRVSRGHESRRPRAQSASERIRSALATSARAWLSNITMLAALSAGTAAAVGYALDPSDVVGALQRENAELTGSAEQAEHLHPLLRVAPRATRPALASILRARIAGVHEVPVSFQEGSTTVQCALVEHATGQTEARLAQLRETGREVAAPPDIAAQLYEHGRALRGANPRSQLELTPLCLAL